MIRAILSIAAAAALLFLSGCNMFAPEPGLQTLAAQRDVQSTQVAVQRATATAASERLRVTLEAAQTAVTSAEIQSTRIAATLIARGMDIVDTRFITPEAGAGLPAAGINPVIAEGVAVIPAQGGAQGNIPLQPPTPTPPPMQINPAATQPAADPNSPALTNIVVAERVGADDCALNPQTSFPSTIAQIYVAATALNIASGTPITARFLRENSEQIRYDWSPGFAIARGCIWFRMPASDVALTPGAWSVELELNGQPAGTVSFEIVGDSA